MIRFATENARALPARAECLYSAEEVSAAIARLVLPLEQDVGGDNPLVLVVMRGGLFFAAHLLQQLNFPLELDYVDASRYGEAVAGQPLQWRRDVPACVQHRTVLLVDDILDEGITLCAVRDRVIELGGRNVKIAVLAEKRLGHAKPVMADYCALTIPDRFVFGSGMDVRGQWRHLPGIFAMSDSDLREP